MTGLIYDFITLLELTGLFSAYLIVLLISGFYFIYFLWLISSSSIRDFFAEVLLLTVEVAFALPTANILDFLSFFNSLKIDS